MMRDKTRSHVESLQDQICAALEAVDGSGGFREDLWQRDGGGGGRTRIFEGGDILEKAGVNVSAVFGQLPEELQASLAGEGPEFYATGLSLVLHPRNPHAPTVHANFRYIERGDAGWFGGGADLTPYVLYEEDARHFHRVFKDVCDRHDPAHYPRFKAWCDEYFYLPHRGECRGVGGLFFDYLRPDETHSIDDLYAWWCEVGGSFLDAYLPILERRCGTPTNEEERLWQLRRRGRYAEFNLVYDRGTLFGLQTRGRTESILMSLPPSVRWDYDIRPAPGSAQEALLAVLTEPRDWV